MTFYLLDFATEDFSASGIEIESDAIFHPAESISTILEGSGKNFIEIIEPDLRPVEPWDQGLGEILEEIIDSEIIKPREEISMDKKDHNGKKDFSEAHNFENPESSKILLFQPFLLTIRKNQVSNVIIIYMP